MVYELRDMLEQAIVYFVMYSNCRVEKCVLRMELGNSFLTYMDKFQTFCFSFCFGLEVQLHISLSPPVV